MSKLIIDIETVGENFDEMDEITKHILTKYIDKDNPEALNEVKEGLVFSPLTGQIVAIGVMDYDKEQGVVYYQSPEVKAEERTLIFLRPEIPALNKPLAVVLTERVLVLVPRTLMLTKLDPSTDPSN